MKELDGQKRNKDQEFPPVISMFLKELEVKYTNELIEKYSVKKLIYENLFDRFESGSTNTPVKKKNIFFAFYQ